MIVDGAIYRNGERHPCGDLSDAVDDLRSNGGPGDFVWIGLKDPTLEEFDLVDGELGLHDLAIEDAVNGRQRAKIEYYEGSVFFVLKPLRYIEATSDIETGELMAFVGDHFLVTVRRGEASPLAAIRARIEQTPEVLAQGPMGTLHAIVDSIVDDYRAIDVEIAADLDDIEAAVFSGNAIPSGAVYRLKREVLEFRRAVAPIVGPMQGLHNSPRSPLTEGELRLQFRDVTDHLQSVLDHVEAYDRLLTDILSAHLAQISVQQNSDMRKISAWVAIAAVPTMIAGIYGMNFANMPELTASITVGGGQFQYGYFVALAVMAGACVLIYRAFKRSGWL